MDPRFKITSGLLKAYKSDDGSRRLKTTASSSIQDHGKDRMFLSALQSMAKSALENMTIFLNHSYTVPEDVLGSVEDVVLHEAGMGPDGAIYDLDFDVRVNESNPRAISTWEAIEAGTKLGTSIGAIVKDYDKNTDGGWDIKDVELLEASIVGIPANPRSWVHYARKSIEDVLKKADDEEPVEPEPATEPAGCEDCGECETCKAAGIEKADTCPTCGKPKAECSGHKSEEPELTASEEVEAVEDTAVELTAELEVELTNQASAQEASADPETATEADTPDPDREVADAMKSLTPEHAAELVKLLPSVQTLAAQFSTLADELAEEREIRLHLQQELDDANANLAVAKQIIDTIADLPLPRKARMTAAVSDFRKQLSGVYSEEFLRMLENK